MTTPDWEPASPRRRVARVLRAAAPRVRGTSRMPITIKNPREIAAMREARQVVALVDSRIQAGIAPGITTTDLDAIARDTIREAGAKAYFYGKPGLSGPS